MPHGGHSSHFLFVLGVGALLGCHHDRDQLDRADRHYTAAEYESAQSNLDDLDGDWAGFDPVQRLRYEYLRGMTAARLSQRAEARHWLAIAREDLTASPRGLSDEAQSLLRRTLAEVDPIADPDAGTDARGSTDAGAGMTAAPGSTQH